MGQVGNRVVVGIYGFVGQSLSSGFIDQICFIGSLVNPLARCSVVGQNLIIGHAADRNISKVGYRYGACPNVNEAL